jgi:hypothetical protein
MSAKATPSSHAQIEGVEECVGKHWAGDCVVCSHTHIGQYLTRDTRQPDPMDFEEWGEPGSVHRYCDECREEREFLIH